MELTTEADKSFDKIPPTLEQRLSDLERRVTATEKVSTTTGDASLMAHVKFVLEKYFPHERPPELQDKQPAANTAPQFVPMLDANGRQMVDERTGNPIFRPADPAPTL